MRPVRFVALAEDGRSLVLRDEAGRMLSLAIDERVIDALTHESVGMQGQLVMETESALTPRDIQARIRSGQTAEDVARAANVPLEKVLRFAGPVLQERAMIAQHARDTRLRTSESGASLASVVDARLAGHGVDVHAVEWDAYRREDGTWRIIASWPSGKATAYAGWDMDAARSVVSPSDNMAVYLSAERPPEILGQDDGHDFDLDDSDTHELPMVPPVTLLRPRRADRSEHPGRQIRDEPTGPMFERSSEKADRQERADRYSSKSERPDKSEPFEKAQPFKARPLDRINGFDRSDPFESASPFDKRDEVRSLDRDREQRRPAEPAPERVNNAERAANGSVRAEEERPEPAASQQPVQPPAAEPVARDRPESQPVATQDSPDDLDSHAETEDDHPAKPAANGANRRGAKPELPGWDDILFGARPHRT